MDKHVSNLDRSLWTILALWISVFPFSGCAKKTAAADSLGNPPVGVVDDAAGFYVRAVLDPNFTYLIHKGTDNTPATSYTYSSTCQINPGDTTKDIMCYVEVNELDLYFNGITLQHNVPSTMCTYFEVLMPWYFKYPVGIGPSISQRTVDSTTTPATNTDDYNSDGGVPYCAYDFSSLTGFNEGPNCCLGRYQLSVISINAAPAGTTSSSSVVDWGGDIGNCLGGPALDLQKKTKSGIPMSEITYVQGKGANGTNKVPSPISKLQGGNVYLANFFSPTTDFDDAAVYPAAFSPGNNTNVPAKRPVASLGSYSQVDVTTQPFYEYRCYDRAQELNYRIRVMVRSWDQSDLVGVSTGPYGVGEGISTAPNNEEETPFDRFPLQDYFVWDLLFPPLTPYGTTFTNGYPLESE